MRSSISSPESVEVRPTSGRDRALIAGWLTGPLAWLTALEANYVLSDYMVCAHGVRWPLHFVVVLAILLSLGAGVAAWGAGADRHATRRRRFMAMAGVALSLGFALVIAAMEFPALAIEPCRS